MSASLNQVNSELAKRTQSLRELKTVLSAIERLDKDRVTNILRIQKELYKAEQLLGSEPTHLELMPPLRDWIASYKRDVEVATKSMRQLFGTELDRLLRSDGMVLSGQVPQLKAGLFAIECNFELGRVTLWYGPNQEQLSVVPLVPQEVFKQIQQSRKELTARPLDEQQFLKQIHEAYQYVIRRKAKIHSEHAPVVAVLVELSYILQDRRFLTDPKREHFKGYSRAQFSYDLYRLHQRRLLDSELALVTATRAFTAKRQDFLWVPSNDRGEGSTYSHLYFREVR